MVSRRRRPLIAIVGQTASGKTRLAIELAEKFNGEIISADSWTVYKGFDIGTAKPTIVEQNRVKFHLIDIAKPGQGFNAALFKRLASQSIVSITSRGKIPILAGGTGLYIDAVLFDYSFAPSAVSRRHALNQLSLNQLIDKTLSMKLDTSNIDTRNKRRLVRLIETGGFKPTKKSLRPDTLIIGLNPGEERLRANVTARVDQMFAIGLEQEVRKLSQLYGWDIEPMKGIGYKEFRSYFAGEASTEAAKSLIIKSTLELARRQQTWFKRNNSIQWFAEQSGIVDIVTSFLNN